MPDKRPQNAQALPMVGGGHRRMVQLMPVGGVEGQLYVAEKGEAEIGTLSVCNQSETPTTIRVRWAINGIASNSKQYSHYDMVLDSNDNSPYLICFNAKLSMGDEIWVESQNGDVSFILWLVEL